MRHPSFPPRPLVLLVLVLLAALAPPAAGQKRRRGKVPKATTEKEGRYTRIELETGGLGYLYVPKGVPESAGKVRQGTRRPGLLVVLHGHGSTAKNMMQPPLADAHRDCMLSVQGSNEVSTGGREGWGWDSAVGAATITGLVRWVLAHHPVVDPKKVVVIGHSAGGSMVFEAYRVAPRLYAGLITVSAPRTPTSAHRKTRVCVFLGTADPNFAGAEAVRAALGGKNRWKHGCFVVLEGAEHNNLPSVPLLTLAVDWCLETKARGAEAHVPFERTAARPARKPFRLVLVGYRGAAGWDDPRQTRFRKGKARKLAGQIARYVAKGKAYFPLEALAHSDHESFKQGGLVGRKDLEAIDAGLVEAADKLEPGTASKVIETARGYCVVWRCPGPKKAGS